MTTRDELIEDFSKREVELVEDIVKCAKLPVSANNFRRLLLLFLRGHYSSAANYMGKDHLSCFTWKEGDDTELLIEYTHQDDDRNPDAVPGIYIGFSQLQWSKVAQGNYAGNTDDNAGTHHSKMSVAQFDIFHTAKKAQDAVDLAELTGQVLTAMGPVLASNAGANNFEVLGVRKPRPKKENPERYYEVVTPVEIQYTLAVTRYVESHRIRMINHKLSTKT